MRLTIFEFINKSTKFNAQGNNKKGMFAQLDIEQWAKLLSSSKGCINRNTPNSNATYSSFSI